MYVDALMIRGAWNYWKRDGSPLPGTREAAGALEHIMALEPNHPGAVHLYVHLFEASAEPERALPQADRLESLMPKEGHMVHMPSHIYLRVGQYEKAIASNERSVEADRYFCRSGETDRFQQKVRITFRPAPTRRTRGTYCTLQRCSKATMRWQSKRPAKSTPPMA